MTIFHGVFSVLPTPFTPDDRVDADSLRRVVDLYLRAGVNGLTALGVTSEAVKLTDTERRLVQDTVLAHTAGRVPVVVTATAAGTAATVEYARAARAAGAAAVMVSPPRMPKLNSETVCRHYRELAAAVDVPIVLQDFPPASGYAMEPALLARIAREVPAVQAIKLEDAPTPFKTARIREQLQGHPITIFGGLGGMYLLEELLAGADGAMTGFAYPEVLVEVVGRFRAGRRDEAADAFYAFVALMRFEFQEGIGLAIRKEMLHRRGAIAHPAVRPPGAALDAATREALDMLLQWARTKQEAAWI
ncbi:MAG TPA: dihydrodipicolinate synthase family protein [Kiritimatiellia bacterium]|nr:dihydrodipicolinate synthase family protein [Kiritimatiellia bacterium]